MSVVKGFDDFEIHDDFFFDDEVGDELAEEAVFEEYRVFGLLAEVDGSFGEFDAEGAFVDDFVVAGAECVVDDFGGGNDVRSEIGMRVFNIIKALHCECGGSKRYWEAVGGSGYFKSLRY